MIHDIHDIHDIHVIWRQRQRRQRRQRRHLTGAGQALRSHSGSLCSFLTGDPFQIPGDLSSENGPQITMGFWGSSGHKEVGPTTSACHDRLHLISNCNILIYNILKIIMYIYISIMYVLYSINNWNIYIYISISLYIYISLILLPITDHRPGVPAFTKACCSFSPP